MARAEVDKTYGKWEVVGEAQQRQGNVRYFTCKCECGTVREVSLHGLRSGSSKSCGHERGRVTPIPRAQDTHGEWGTNLYRRWAGMKKRCLDKNSNWYHRYGGRGITVCKGWMSFEGFRDWAKANGYDPKLSLDRIDNDLGYFPANCRWVTKTVQSYNRAPYGAVPYRGVYKGLRGTFVSCIRVSGTSRHIGVFTNPEDAARAWDSYVITNNLKGRTLNNLGEKV